MAFLIFISPVVKSWNLTGIFGLFEKISLPWPISVALIFIMFDFWMYLWHRANHQIRFFWLFHRAHHNDTDMDSTTAIRTHPFELISASFFNISLVFLFGINLSHLLVYNLVSQSSVFFHHSNIALPEKLDRLLRAVVVTPHMHRLHHSPNDSQRNANYSSVFSFWDRALGSFQKRQSAEPQFYGLVSFRLKKWQDIGGFLCIPFMDEKETT